MLIVNINELISDQYGTSSDRVVGYIDDEKYKG